VIPAPSIGVYGATMGLLDRIDIHIEEIQTG
jgi:hypothetical protein